MFELLQYQFMQNAVLASVLGGAACSLIGVLVITLNLSFIGTCMAHAALAGAILGLLFGFPPLGMAFIFCCLAAGMIGPLADKGKFRPDTALAIIFSLMLGLSFLFLNMLSGPKTEALNLIWGSILTVTGSDLVIMAITFLLVCGFILFFFKEIQTIIFNRQIAAALGIPAQIIYYGALFLIGTTITSFFTSIGGMLIFSLIVNPAAAAYQLTYSLPKMFILSALFGVSSCLGGLWAAYIFNVPAGAVIIIVSVLIFFSALAVSPKGERSLFTLWCKCRGEIWDKKLDYKLNN